MRLLVIFLLKAYRLVISPLYGQVCRYYPSCSAYALESVTRHGAGKGLWLAAVRLSRCHPWACGGYDPVPKTFHWFPSRDGESEELA
jgi:uncharacterized protein